MNHTLNAKLHNLPPCPECEAAAGKPCVYSDTLRMTREPHRSRERIAHGELLYDDRLVRDARRVRAVRELAAVIHATAQRRRAST